MELDLAHPDDLPGHIKLVGCGGVSGSDGSGSWVRNRKGTHRKRVRADYKLRCLGKVSHLIRPLLSDQALAHRRNSPRPRAGGGRRRCQLLVAVNGLFVVRRSGDTAESRVDQTDRDKTPLCAQPSRRQGGGLSDVRGSPRQQGRTGGDARRHDCMAKQMPRRLPLPRARPIKSVVSVGSVLRRKQNCLRGTQIASSRDLWPSVGTRPRTRIPACPYSRTCRDVLPPWKRPVAPTPLG